MVIPKTRMKYFDFIKHRRCTEVKDKNDKKICEGNIIKDEKTGMKYIISFGFFNTMDTCGFGFWKKLINGFKNKAMTSDCSTEIIIGNIYENPELLNS